jgi:hypothetical protein
MRHAAELQAAHAPFRSESGEAAEEAGQRKKLRAAKMVEKQVFETWAFRKFRLGVSPEMPQIENLKMRSERATSNGDVSQRKSIVRCNLSAPHPRRWRRKSHVHIINKKKKTARF